MLALPAIARGIGLRGKTDIVDEERFTEAAAKLNSEINADDTFAERRRKFRQAAFRPFAPYILSYLLSVTVLWLIAFGGVDTRGVSAPVVILTYLSLISTALFYRSTWQTLACVMTLLAFNYVGIGVEWISRQLG